MTAQVKLQRGLRLAGSHRTVAIMAGVAVVCLVVGFGLTRLVESPGAAAAKAAPPPAGPITAKVERRALANVVTIRGDVGYDKSTDVSVVTSDLTGPAIVTAQPLKAGTKVSSGSVIAQITGRPVIALAGDLPTYRTLRVGSQGPDVVQLKRALGALKLAPGGGAEDTFDEETAHAVRRLYEHVGYGPPEPDKAAQDAFKAAEAAQDDALAAVKQARDARARAGAVDATSLNAARRALADAEATASHAADKPLCAGAVQDPSSCYPNRADKDLAVALARNALTQAREDLAATQRPATADIGAAQDQLESASRALTQANQTLAEARAAVLPYLPASEVVYLTSLPRRVDEILAAYGQSVSGPIMKVSGSQLAVTAAASEEQAELLKVGDKAQIALANDAEQIDATVTAIGGAAKAPVAAQPGDGPQEQAAASPQRTVRLSLPKTLTNADAAALRGNNVRVRIPIESTKGEVLAVPIAALFADTSGASHVTKVAGDGSTTTVRVTQGLAAEGFVEVTPSGGALAEGDLVVVGAS